MIEVNISLEEFAAALTGLAGQACDFTIYDAPVGKKREVKNVVVKRPGFGQSSDRSGERMAMARRAAVEYLVDGWDVDRPDDLFNHHHWVGMDDVSVTRVRYV